MASDFQYNQLKIALQLRARIKEANSYKMKHAN